MNVCVYRIYQRSKGNRWYDHPKCIYIYIAREKRASNPLSLLHDNFGCLQQVIDAIKGFDRRSESDFVVQNISLHLGITEKGNLSRAEVGPDMIGKGDIAEGWEGEASEEGGDEKK